VGVASFSTCSRDLGVSMLVLVASPHRVFLQW
jgi:hypothetical protein